MTRPKKHWDPSEIGVDDMGETTHRWETRRDNIFGWSFFCPVCNTIHGELPTTLWVEDVRGVIYGGYRVFECGNPACAATWSWLTPGD